MRAPAPRFAAAVFDMDGLLLDSERPVRSAWLDAAAQHGCALQPSDYAGLIGLNHTDSHTRLRTLLGGDEAVLARVRQRAQELLAQRLGTRGFEPTPGAARLLARLQRAGVACAVASSTAPDEVRQRLQAAGLLGFFVSICGGDEVRQGKPHPDLYALALTRLGVAAPQAGAFEDSGPGVQSALAAGLLVVAVPDLAPPQARWLHRCLAVLPTLDDACPHCADWFGAACVPGP